MLPVVFSKAEAEAELELARVEGRGGAAVVAAVGGALVEAVDVEEEAGRRGLVEAVEEVEALGDHVQAEALAEADGARHPQVERGVGVRDAAVAAQAPVGEEVGQHE